MHLQALLASGRGDKAWCEKQSHDRRLKSFDGAWVLTVLWLTSDFKWAHNQTAKTIKTSKSAHSLQR
jgi:hypothetical protein